MSDEKVTVNDVRVGLAKALKSAIDNYADTLVELRKRELKAADPLAKSNICPLCKAEDMPGLCKCLMAKSEDLIDLANESDPKKRIKEVGGTHAGVLPGDKASKEIDTTEGSGGSIKKGKKLSKDTKKAEDEWQKQNAAATAAGKRGVPVPPKGTKERKNLSLASDRDEAAKTKKAEVPMAKPPTAKPAGIPMSKPGAGSKPVVKDELEKGDFGMGDNGKVATLPKPGGAAPGGAPKPKYTMDMHNAAKAKLPKVGPSNFAKPSAAPKLPGAAPAAAPKLPGAAPAAPAQKPGLLGKLFGKSEDFYKCPLCKKAEHLGDCK